MIGQVDIGTKWCCRVPLANAHKSVKNNIGKLVNHLAQR